uniref:Nucleocapsid n=1 Tax=Orthorubulavirus mapueraense TaxID=3052559 RepID=Q83666_9MONO|nr:nucleocapsid protein [Orthorubulavirus mapueraense]
MSSVLSMFERFTMEQELQDRGAEGTLPPETIKSTIKVFILNSDDPRLRWKMMNFCLRLIMSDAAKISRKVGAMITLFSLPASGMQNHVRLADRSPDAQIERIEIEGFAPDSFKLILNERSSMTQEEINSLDFMARELPKGFQGKTVYLNVDAEGLVCDEVEQFLDRAYTVLLQVWILACKCMTAYDQPAASIKKRTDKYKQQGRFLATYTLQAQAQATLQNVIRQSLIVRQFMAYELQISRHQGTITNRYYALVGDIGKYIENAGMSAFFLTIKYALGTRWQPLALAAFSGELTKIKSLMMLYRDLGENARYLALLEAPQMMEFAPANYPLLYSYAMGIGTVLDAQMRNYKYGRDFLNPVFFQFGVETARKQQSAVDVKMAAELGVTTTDKEEMAQTLTRLGAARRTDASAYAATPFSGPAQQAQAMPAPQAIDSRDSTAQPAAPEPVPDDSFSSKYQSYLIMQEKMKDPALIDGIRANLLSDPNCPEDISASDLQGAVERYVHEVIERVRQQGDYTGIWPSAGATAAEAAIGDFQS